MDVIDAPSVVMAGLDPAIYVFLSAEAKTWMPGTRPGMTSLWSTGDPRHTEPAG
jgi:hypothetical protein